MALYGRIGLNSGKKFGSDLVFIGRRGAAKREGRGWGSAKFGFKSIERLKVRPLV